MQANRHGFIACLVILALVVTVRGAVQVTSQGGSGQAPIAPVPPVTPAAPAGRGGPTSFPAQQRPPDDPGVVARGKQVYDISCRACHGPDLRGGDMGGPNLLRSDVMLNDKNGEILSPVVKGSRASDGMPAVDLPPDDVTAVAAFIHSVLATSRAQGAPPAGPPVQLNVLVGDAAAGEVYFNAKCTACHSITGDLQGIGTRASDPMRLQNLWVGAGQGSRGVEPGGPDALPSRRTVIATVTTVPGPIFQGRLDRIDDFMVTLILPDGTRRSFSRVGETPKVDINDPLSVHKAMLATYTDRDIHNVTAYLVTLK